MNLGTSHCWLQDTFGWDNTCLPRHGYSLLRIVPLFLLPLNDNLDYNELLYLKGYSLDGTAGRGVT